MDEMQYFFLSIRFFLQNRFYRLFVLANRLSYTPRKLFYRVWYYLNLENQIKRENKKLFLKEYISTVITREISFHAVEPRLWMSSIEPN